MLADIGNHLTLYHSVVIICKTFAVIFTTALLTFSAGTVFLIGIVLTDTYCLLILVNIMIEHITPSTEAEKSNSSSILKFATVAPNRIASTSLPIKIPNEERKWSEKRCFSRANVMKCSHPIFI